MGWEEVRKAGRRPGGRTGNGRPGARGEGVPVSPSVTERASLCSQVLLQSCQGRAACLLLSINPTSLYPLQ